MPSASYRRKLRTQNHYIKVPPVIECEEGDNELIKMHKYFYRIIDLISKQENLSQVATSLETKIKSFKTIMEYYTILATIEVDLLSIAANIMDEVAPEMIRYRINNVKNYIAMLPHNCQDVGPVALMTLDIVSTLKHGINFSRVENNLQQVKAYINEKYGKNDEYNNIHDSFLSIINNIKNDVAPSMIEYRLNYVRDIVKTLTL
jgi:hypothetical protein